MDKIKILYLVSTLKKCGPVNVLHGIISGLHPNQFEIYIISLSPEGPESAQEMFKVQDVHITNLNNSRLKGLVKNRQDIQLFIDRFNINITHSHGIRADQINSKLKNVIRFNTIHNFPAEDYTLRYGKTKGSLMEIAHRRAIAKIHHPVACSGTISDKFLSFYRIKTAIVQNGIDTKRFFPDKKQKPQLRKELRLPEDKKIFIVSAALTNLKNPVTILKAFNEIQDSESALLFIGDGHLLQPLSEANKKDSILFRGRVERVNDYLKASDYYISASLTEGLPNAVLEALSTGLPSLLSNIPSHREIVGDLYPYLFDPADAADLSDKMQQLLNTDHEESTGCLQGKVNSEFSSKVMSEKYKSLYLKHFKKTVLVYE